MSRRAVAVLVGLVSLVGCSEPVQPRLSPGAPLFSGEGGPPPVEPFFVAYSEGPWTTELGIQTIPFWAAHGPGQYRIWTNSLCGVDPCFHFTNFAAYYPGRLYVVGDEPDLYCVSPAEYAGQYKFFVDSLLNVDPTAKFSPAGFSEPNPGCGCPEGDTACYQAMHGTGYANQFYNAYHDLYGVYPRVDEWRFHNFGGSAGAYLNVQNWKAEIQALAAWSVAHPSGPGGASSPKLYLGAWSFFPWQEPQLAFLDHMNQTMDFLLSDSRIAGAAWYQYEAWDPWPHVPDENPHYLRTASNTLTPEGETLRYGPMSVNIYQGPSVVRPGVECSWSGGVFRAVPPYTYQWTVSNHPQQPYSTSNPLYYTNDGFSFTLTWTVWDKYGVMRTATKNVLVSDSAPDC
jgi:hypothetical protein